jgi:hypothetical protein
LNGGNMPIPRQNQSILTKESKIGKILEVVINFDEIQLEAQVDGRDFYYCMSFEDWDNKFHQYSFAGYSGVLWREKL